MRIDRKPRGRHLPHHWRTDRTPMYTALTHDIQVTVTPRYLPEESDPDRSRYMFAYTVEIANLGPAPVQLRSRYWKITDGQGRVQEVRGPGVVGEEPLIEPGHAFEYTSGCPLPTPSGFMVGSYHMQDINGRWFTIDIPAFALDTPDENRRLN